MWCLSNRADPVAKKLADRHYNRQKIGSPQFVPPGACLVLLTDCGKAFWVTSAPIAAYVKHAWAGAWVCSAFRSEGAGNKASELIRQAVAHSRWHFERVPALGIVTFIDRSQVRPIMVRGVKTWGWTFMKAGFSPVGETKGGLLAFQMLPQDMPEAAAPKPRSTLGLALFTVGLGTAQP
jgi:hypothetical protein